MEQDKELIAKSWGNSQETLKIKFTDFCREKGLNASTKEVQQMRQDILWFNRWLLNS